MCYFECYTTEKNYFSNANENVIFYLVCLHWMMVKLGNKKVYGKKLLSYRKTKSIDHI